MVPATLTESYMVSKTEDRLLVLLTAVMDFVERGADNVCLVFTSSVKSTHRLARLLQIFHGTGSVSDLICLCPHVCCINERSAYVFVDKKLGGEVFEISRIVSQESREAALRAACDGTAKVTV